jgi:hypothetical protein
VTQKGHSYQTRKQHAGIAAAFRLCVFRFNHYALLNVNDIYSVHCICVLPLLLDHTALYFVVKLTTMVDCTDGKRNGVHNCDPDSRRRWSKLIDFVYASKCCIQIECRLFCVKLPLHIPLSIRTFLIKLIKSVL